MVMRPLNVWISLLRTCFQHSHSPSTHDLYKRCLLPEFQLSYSMQVTLAVCRRLLQDLLTSTGIDYTSAPRFSPTRERMTPATCCTLLLAPIVSVFWQTCFIQIPLNLHPNSIPCYTGNMAQQLFTIYPCQRICRIYISYSKPAGLWHPPLHSWRVQKKKSTEPGDLTVPKGAAKTKNLSWDSPGFCKDWQLFTLKNHTRLLSWKSIFACLVT